MTALSTDAQRILAVAILMAVLFGLYLGIARPLYIAVTDIQFRQDQLKDHLSRYRAIAASRISTEQNLKRLLTSEKKLVGLVDGETPEIAAATLQGIVGRTIRKSAGRVRSEQNLSARKENGFDRLEVRYDFSVPLSTFPDLTNELERSLPYLWIHAIQVRAPETYRSGAAVTGTVMLNVRLTVVAYRRMVKET